MNTSTVQLAFAAPLAVLASNVLALDVTSFPLDLRAVDEGVLEFEQSPTALAALAGFEHIVMQAVPSPDGAPVDLELKRIRFDFSSVGVFVDGKESCFQPGDMTLWSGKLRGVESSDVQLCFASRGTYGWIFDGVDYTHITSTPGKDGTWNLARVRMIDDRIMRRGGNRGLPSTCMVDQIGPTPGHGGSIQSDARGPRSLGAATKLELMLAIETDWQLFQRWNDLHAEQTYVMALLAAKSARFSAQVDIAVTYPYVQFYTTSNDPWTTQDGGGGAVDLLYEFQAAWKFAIPADAHLAHFLSGASLGGGVAWLDVLCNPEWGFSVSGNINGGVTFPVTPGSNTWDFYVFAHETGHNVGTLHTHDYCPPLDECAPPGSFGECQNQQVCISHGTIMSYCHLCQGGTSNITTFFHPTVVNYMRNEAENSCLRTCDLKVALSDYPASVEGGDTLSFQASATNRCDVPLAFDQAVMNITGPASMETSLYHGAPFNVEEDLSRDLRVTVPTATPLGNYMVAVSIFRNGEEIDVDTFEVVVAD